MTIQEKISRSKVQRSDDFRQIKSKSSGESLVPVKSNDKLRVMPIWDDRIGDIEGGLYSDYIKKNPKYNRIFVRKSVSERLTDASQNLPQKYSLIIRAGHRPLDVQYALLEGVKQSYLKKKSSATDEEALKFARMFVSDPTISLPPHCCGSAVDVDMLDKDTGELVDFGCPVNTEDPISFLHSEKITPEQKSNRLILLTAMLGAGFSSLPNEWWHYSYGDQMWAWFYKQPEAIYSITEPNL